MSDNPDSQPDKFVWKPYKKWDSKAKSFYWSVTAWGAEADFIDGKNWPPWMLDFVGGREMCPTTGREHWQGCLHTRQVRGSQVKKVFPTAHLELPNDEDAIALKAYCMKKETAIGPKGKIENERKYRHVDQLIQLMAVEYITMYPGDNGRNIPKDELETRYMRISRSILEKDITMMGYFDDKLKSFFKRYVCVPVCRLIKEGGPYSITSSLPAAPPSYPDEVLEVPDDCYDDGESTNYEGSAC